MYTVTNHERICIWLYSMCIGLYTCALKISPHSVKNTCAFRKYFLSYKNNTIPFKLKITPYPCSIGKGEENMELNIKYESACNVDMKKQQRLVKAVFWVANRYPVVTMPQPM